MTRSYTPRQIADDLLSGKFTRDSAFVPLAEVEKLRAERDEAWAEVERLRCDAHAIAAIAHTGGTAGLSEHAALVEIRRRTLRTWDRKTSRAALEAKP